MTGTKHKRPEAFVADLLCESRIEKPHPVYVPRDEAFEELKQDAFTTGRLKAVLHNLIPTLKASISANNFDFQCFHDIDNLYKEGLLLKLGIPGHLLHKIPLVKKIYESGHGLHGLLRYDTPIILSKDKFAWLRDDEMGRQALAGINPVNIERVKVFPPISKLDPDVYGSPESAITEAHIAGHLNGMSVHQVKYNLILPMDKILDMLKNNLQTSCVELVPRYLPNVNDQKNYWHVHLRESIEE